MLDQMEGRLERGAEVLSQKNGDGFGRFHLECAILIVKLMVSKTQWIDTVASANN